MYSSKFNLRPRSGSRVLSFISLLFMVMLVFSCFVSVFHSVSPFALGAYSIISNESGLRNAVDNVPFGGATVITIVCDIVLTEEFRVSYGKDVTLVSNGDVECFKLIGVDGKSTIVVENGVLRLDGVIITHADGASGNGVTVHPDGMLIMSAGEISGNSASRGNGGGVFNDGTFVLSGGVISGNTAYSLGGGVFNRGSFRMNGGVITGNVASFGGGMHTQLGSFSMFDGEISGNTANWDGGGMYNQESDFVLVGGVISGNIASKNGGGLCVSYFSDLEKVFIEDGVVFENNWASAAYTRDSAHNELYNSRIGRNVVWTAPFKQGYNNYDISYTWGTLYNSKNNQYALFAVAALIVVLCIVVVTSAFHRKKSKKIKQVKKRINP